MKDYTLLLEDWTIGVTFADSVAVGDIVTVRLDDENGNPINVTGEVIEVLAEKELHK